MSKAHPNYILIDIRNGDEVLAKHLDSRYTLNYYNIPMNMIRFNRAVILNHLQWVDTVYIMCNSGARSQFIKDKYFADEPKVKVSSKLQFNQFHKPGQYSVTLNDGTTLKIYVTGTFSYNLYSITRLIQIMLGTIMIVCASYMLAYGSCKKTHVPLYVVLLFGTMALINGVTNTCTLSLLLRDMLN